MLVASSVFIPRMLTDAVKSVASSGFAYKLRAISKEETVPEYRLVDMVVGAF